jgi:HAD superfamily hydrolase (TIGR01662 family)
MTIKIVLFDLGSTLIFFNGSWPEIIARSHRELTNGLLQAGFKVDPKTFPLLFDQRWRQYSNQRESEWIEYPTQAIVRDLLIECGNNDFDEDGLRTAMAAMYRVSQDHWHIEQDAVPMLQQLSQQGYLCGIVSNAGDDADVQKLVDLAEIRDYFDIIISSAGVGIRKPNPDIFCLALARWGAIPQEAVMVGDTLSADILGAHNVGMRGIWITRRADTPENNAKRGEIFPDASISALSELPELLGRWEKTS